MHSKEMQIDDFEFVLVNDCSPDDGATIAELNRLGDEFPYVAVVDLGKNAGQHNATMAGLNYATGDFIVSMDDDLQSHPPQLHKLIEKMDEGYDIVYGYYEKKEENLFRRLGSALNHWTVCKLLGKPKWLKTSSYWMIRRYVRDYAIQYTFPNVHLQGVFLRVTDNITNVPLEHFARAYGTSTYTFSKLVRLYLNILTFSTVPIRLMSNLGFLLAGFGFALDVFLLIRKLLNPHYATGWVSLAGALCFFSGMILIGLGMVGTYVGRLLIGQTHSPQFVVRTTKNEKVSPREQ